LVVELTLTKIRGLLLLFHFHRFPQVSRKCVVGGREREREERERERGGGGQKNRAEEEINEMEN
jgi:hypothetical protein